MNFARRVTDSIVVERTLARTRATLGDTCRAQRDSKPTIIRPTSRGRDKRTTVSTSGNSGILDTSGGLGTCGAAHIFPGNL
jgi:hypothetical protein